MVCLAALLGLAAVTSGSAAAAGGAGAGNGELAPIQADQARPALPASAATDIRYDGRTVSAMAYLVRVDAPAAHAASSTAKTTVTAFSLNLQSSPAVGVWQAVAPNTEGIGGLRSAALIAGAPARTTPRDVARELAARQIAIWHYTNGLAINRSTVPNPRLRRRALVLSKQASTGSLRSGTEPTSIGITENVANVSLTGVTIDVLLSSNGETSFCNPQKLDISVGGRDGTVRTGSVSTLRRAGSDAFKVSKSSLLSGPPCPKGLARDYNEALFTLPRPRVGTAVEVDWNLTLPGINVFENVNNGSAPPLLVVGGNKPNLEFRQTLPLDPSTFPTAHTYLEQFLTTLISKFHGIWAIVVLLVLLALAPLFSQGLQGAAKLVGGAVGKRARGMRANAGGQRQASRERPSPPSAHSSDDEVEPPSANQSQGPTPTGGAGTGNVGSSPTTPPGQISESVLAPSAEGHVPHRTTPGLGSTAAPPPHAGTSLSRRLTRGRGSRRRRRESRPPD